VPFAFVKNVVQIAFLTHATSVSLCGNLSVGSLTMTLCLRFGPFRTRNRAGARQMHGAHLQKQLQIAFCNFHLISSVSRPQRPLIYD
jgi:hypothetical protein